MIILITALLTFSVLASSNLKFDGMIDTYYAYDSNHSHERAYTTQPSKHDNPSVNLAYAGVYFEQSNFRSRLALQAGDSVKRNTTNEPNGGKSGGLLSPRDFQEAYVGYQVNEKTWVDGGIYLGHIGAESWLSKDNWTYTRALNLDYVPYYAAGVRLEHRLSEKELFQVHLMNGWQNMSENNHAKAIAFQYKKDLSSDITFNYNNFLGDEEVVRNPVTGKFNPRFRTYQNFILKWKQNAQWSFLSAFDFGTQSQQNNDGVDTWQSLTFTARYTLHEDHHLASRISYYNDPHQTNISTGTANGFQVGDISLNYDFNLMKNFLWRTEVRAFKSKDKIYPTDSSSKNDWDSFLVTSLTFWI